MAETLGSLCDKLTVVKLKQWHSEDPTRLESLTAQAKQLQEEIDDFARAAVAGEIQPGRLAFAANKVYKREGNDVRPTSGGIGAVFAQLAHVNCALWHEQEKVYAFESVLPGEKDAVVKKLALLNLERNQCIERIDGLFRAAIEGRAS